MRGAPVTALAGLCALLAVVLACLWFTPAGGLRDAVRWHEPAPLTGTYVAQGIALQAAEAAGSPALQARPLFSMTRRPPVPATAAAVDSAPDRLAGARVRAIVEGPDAVSSAILEIDGKSRRILKHQAFEGWTLASLNTQERTVTLIRDGQKRVLVLQRGQMAAASRPRLPASRPSASTPPSAASVPGGPPQ